MKANNLIIREALLRCGVHVYELADILELSETTMTRRLRHEYTTAEQEDIAKRIEKYAKKRRERT